MMFDYIEDIVASAPPDMRGIAPDPAKLKLFDVHKTLPRLNSREANEFHSIYHDGKVVVCCETGTAGYTISGCLFVY